MIKIQFDRSATLADLEPILNSTEYNNVLIPDFLVHQLWSDNKDIEGFESSKSFVTYLEHCYAISIVSYVDEAEDCYLYFFNPSDITRQHMSGCAVIWSDISEPGTRSDW